ncbi:3-phosphoshikimate 1-carboxyvinyltransferase, partial [Candidatus Roizmanbacteria bacterium CG_4_9_14_0_2_um_filter_36_12]
MKILVRKSNNLIGKFHVPPAKSHGWRALFLAGLAHGKSKIIRPKESKDWLKAIEGMRQFGAKINKVGESWLIEGIGNKVQVPDNVIECGNSGPLLRYFGIISAVLTDKYVVITGDESLRHNRLAKPVVDAVNQLGGWGVTTKSDNHAPIIIKGKINGGKCTVDGAESQIVSALLIGCSLCQKDTEIFVTNAGEKPWVELTISWLKKAGIKVHNIGNKYEHFRVSGGQILKPLGNVVIPADWQSIPTVLLAGILIPGSKIEVINIDPKDSCPDRLVVPVLKKMGADIKFTNNSVVAQFSPHLKGTKVDANNFTDQFVPIAIAAAFAQGKTEIFNNEIQHHKECDRIKAVTKALISMGVKVMEKKDGLIIKGNGGKDLKGAKINSHKDHRMVM